MNGEAGIYKIFLALNAALGSQCRLPGSHTESKLDSINLKP